MWKGKVIGYDDAEGINVRYEACEEGVVRHDPTAHDEAPQAEEIPVGQGRDE